MVGAGRGGRQAGILRGQRHVVANTGRHASREDRHRRRGVVEAAGRQTVRHDTRLHRKVAYASDDGTIVWQFDTNRAFDTVNGVKANGATMDGPGATVVNGMLYVNSGYGGIVGRPGNVLLAFGVD